METTDNQRNDLRKGFTPLGAAFRMEPLLVAKQWSSMKVLAAALFLFAFVQVVPAAPQNGRCDLPQDLQREITTKYPGRKLVTISDLQEGDRTLFPKDHGDSCPGLVQVDFYGDGKPTFAMVLLTKDNSELVVAHRVGETWRSTVLGTGGPNAPVVWSLPPGEYTSVDGDKKIRATKSVIVFVQYEAWGILYSWTGNAVRKIWIAD